MSKKIRKETEKDKGSIGAYKGIEWALDEGLQCNYCKHYQVGKVIRKMTTTNGGNCIAGRMCSVLKCKTFADFPACLNFWPSKYFLCLEKGHRMAIEVCVKCRDKNDKDCKKCRQAPYLKTVEKLKNAQTPEGYISKSIHRQPPGPEKSGKVGRTRVKTRVKVIAKKRRKEVDENPRPKTKRLLKRRMPNLNIKKGE